MDNEKGTIMLCDECGFIKAFARMYVIDSSVFL